MQGIVGVEETKMKKNFSCVLSCRIMSERKDLSRLVEVEKTSGHL